MFRKVLTGVKGFLVSKYETRIFVSVGFLFILASADSLCLLRDVEDRPVIAGLYLITGWH